MGQREYRIYLLCSTVYFCCLIALAVLGIISFCGVIDVHAGFCGVAAFCGIGVLTGGAALELLERRQDHDKR